MEAVSKHVIHAVRIIWHDAHSLDEWRVFEDSVDVMKNPFACETLGWLIHQDKECVVLAMTLARDATRTLQTVAIPRGMIKKMNRVTFK